jgi:SAM-dependent methyltransferase
MAFDVWPSGVSFCERVIGARGVITPHDPDDVELGERFDLIWCGSLLTHVGAEPFVGFLKLFERHLAPGGVVVFTTHGRFTVAYLRRHASAIDFTEEQQQQVLRDYDETGFGFYASHDVPHEKDTGDSVASRAWVCKQLEHTPDLKLLLYVEHAWLGQDVIACSRLGS